LETQSQAETPGRWRVLAPFRIREYRLLITAVSLSIFAEGMWTVVMALQVIALDSDPTSLSLVATCLAVGLVAFLPVGGIAADRIEQRRIIIAVETLNVVAVSAVAILGSLDALRIWHMAIAAGALGVAAAFFFPAYSAILPRILPADQLLAANGVEGVVRPVFQEAIGPAVAGLLIAATFPSVGAIAVATLLGVSLALLVATRPAAATSEADDEAESGDEVERPHVLRDLRDGFAFVLGTQWLKWTLLFASFFVLIVLGPIEILLPFIAKERFADGAKAYGFILAFFGVGSAIGALAVSSARLPRRYLTFMMVMWGAGSLPLVFVVGVTDGAGAVIWGTLLQRRVPTEMLGRVSSLDFFVSLVFLPVSFAIVGPLSMVLSMQTIFLVAGIAPVVLAAVAMVAARMPRDEIANPLR
jgi:DHA3 family tetracycline resistance protein-like MFS transporter